MTYTPPEPAAVHVLERSGLRVLWSPRDDQPRAALAFRVGLLDEPYARGGITHLVEHLALTELDDVPYWVNGYVSTQQTAFLARGSEAELREFLGQVARSLADLPVDRIDVERSVLEAEAGNLPGLPTVPFLAHVRWGLQAPGRRGVPELGLRTATADDLKRWARERFTAAAATLCWVGPEPPDLGLSLPAGPATPLPPDPRTLVNVPSAVHGDDDVVPVGFTLRGGSGRAALFMDVLEHQLLRVLRHERGIVYSVDAGVHAITPDLTHATAVIEVETARAAEVAAVIDATLGGLARGEVTPDELTASARRISEPSTDPDWVLAHLLEMAATTAAGAAPRDVAAELAHLGATDAAAIAELAAEARASALLVLPGDVAAPGGWPTTDGPGTPTAPVEGREFSRGGLRRSRRQRLVIGERGFTLSTGSAPPQTAWWTDIVAITRERGGEYSISEVDGSWWQLDPSSFGSDADEIARLIEEHAGPDVLVPAEGAAQFAAVDEAAARDLKKPGQLRHAADALATLLEPGEEIRQLASAITGKMQWGLLAVTDRRTLFVVTFGDEPDVAQHRHTAVRGVRVEESMKGKTLVLDTGSEPRRYWGFDRQSEPGELRDHLQALLAE